MNDDIFDRWEANAPRAAVPPRPAHLVFTADQLRAELAATPAAELEQLIEQAEDVHHAHLLARWTVEVERHDQRAEFDSREALMIEWLERSTLRTPEEVAEEEEAARERARNRRTSAGSGPIATLSGDDEQLGPDVADDEVQHARASMHVFVHHNAWYVGTDHGDIKPENVMLQISPAPRPRRPFMRAVAIAMVLQVFTFVVFLAMSGGLAVAAVAAAPAAFWVAWEVMARRLPEHPVRAAGRWITRHFVKWVLGRGLRRW